jgi:carboxymethylenebutenolidase
MAMRRYLVEEVVDDYAEAHLTRRDALWRLGLLGVGALGASSLLAACGGDDDASSDGAGTTRPAGTSTSTSVPGAIPTPASIVRFDGPNGELQGAWAPAARPKGSVLVIHENRGLTDHIRTIPPRFAAAGYSALAIDLLSEEGGTAALGGDAQAMGALGQAPVERLLADLRAGIDELERREAGHKVAVIGFCFGGGMTWQLLAAGEPRLAAAAPFYGPAPASPDFSGSNAAVLAVYGELDARVNATRDAAQAALERDGLTHEVRVFSGANHAFFNDTGPSFNAAAATEAFQAVLAWFGRYLD